MYNLTRFIGCKVGIQPLILCKAQKITFKIHFDVFLQIHSTKEYIAMDSSGVLSSRIYGMSSILTIITSIVQTFQIVHSNLWYDLSISFSLQERYCVNIRELWIVDPAATVKW